MSIFDLIDKGDIQGLIDHLIKAPEDVNLIIGYYTPLEYALSKNQPKIFEILYRFHKGYKIYNPRTQEMILIQTPDNKTAAGFKAEHLDHRIFDKIPLDRWLLLLSKKDNNEKIADSFLAVVPKEDQEYDFLIFTILVKFMEVGTDGLASVKKYLQAGRGINFKAPDGKLVSFLHAILTTYSIQLPEIIEVIESLLKIHQDKAKIIVNTPSHNTYALPDSVPVYPIQQAVQQGRHEVVKILYPYVETYPAKYGNTILHDLVASLKPEVSDFEAALGFLLDKININVLNDALESPLFIAIDSNKRLGLIQYLISKGADLKLKNRYNVNLLMKACDNADSEETTEYLAFIEQLCGVIDIKARNAYGETALHIASKKGNLQLVQMLLKYNADVHAVSVEGFSAYDTTAFINSEQHGLIFSYRTTVHKQFKKQRENKLEYERGESIRTTLQKAGASECSVSNVFVRSTEQVLSTLTQECSLNIEKRKNQELEYKKLAEKMDAMDFSCVVERADKISSAARVQHKQTLWSLTQRNSRKLLEKTPRDRCVDISVGNIRLKLADYTNREDYSFIIHTTSTSLCSLKTKLTGAVQDASELFIKTTPYFSCSFVDKETPPGEMNHQLRNIFPISFILDLGEGTVLKAFPSDVGSPYGGADDKDRKEYIRTLQELNQKGNDLEYVARQSSEAIINAKCTSPYSLDLFSLQRIYSQSKHYVGCSYGRPGTIPEFTPLQVLRRTNHGFYNELIVLGHPRNRVMGIMIEKKLLEDFHKTFTNKQLQAEYHKKAEEALQILADLQKENPNFPLILVDTHTNKLDKLPLHLQFEPIQKEYSSLSEHVAEHLLIKNRLKTSIAHLESLSDAAKEPVKAPAKDGSKEGSKAGSELLNLLAKQRKHLEQIEDALNKDSIKLLETQEKLKGIRDSLK